MINLEDCLAGDLKEGLVDKYIYKDGKKYIGQLIKKKECRYKKIQNFSRKTRDEYFSIHNSLLKNMRRKKISKLNTNLPTDRFIEIEKFNPMGKNIGTDYESISINNLMFNSVNTKKYIVMKIISKICADKDIKFICEDNNNDVIIVSINDSQIYFAINNVRSLEKDIYTEGKYIIVIEPNYGVFESETDIDIDVIDIAYPNEIIILNNKDELNYFLEKTHKISTENYKLLGNLMIKNNFYEKAIYYYNKAINIDRDNDINMDIILHSNLSEAYIKYGYFTKCINNADYCLNKINKLMKKGNYINNEKESSFLSQQLYKNLFRKIKALVALRKFKEAYDILFNTSETNPYKNIMNTFLNMEQVQKLIGPIKDGYENNLGHFNFVKMVKDEKINFNLNTYGDYFNPKLELQFEKNKGIKIIAKEQLHKGELLIVEKALVSSQVDPNIDEDDDNPNVSKDNPTVVVEIDMFNKLGVKLKKYPLDYEKFYCLCDGTNVNEDLNQRRKYSEKQDNGTIDLDTFKVNQVICLNKYGNGRTIIYYKETCVGVWGYASFFNHNCLPNTSHLAIGDYYIGYCIKDINKGEEITSSYVDAKLPYKERQQTILENWRFKCCCELCKYQEKKNDTEYNNFIEIFNKSNKEISKKNAKDFEEFLEKRKKMYSCYELANGYLLLEKYYYIGRDFKKAKKFSELVTKYADGKNFSFQLSNLDTIFLTTSASKNDECFIYSHKIVNYLKEYTPFTREEINFFIKDNLGLNCNIFF